MYMNNHHTGHSPSQTKPNLTHECKKCHVSKIMMLSLPFGKARAQQLSLPMQLSVLLSGRDKSREFPGPHPVTQPLLTGTATCSSSSPQSYLAGLHVCVEGQELQIVKVAVVMTMIMTVMMMIMMLLLVRCSNFLVDICT